MEMLCHVMEQKIKRLWENLNNQSWDELWNSVEAENVRKKYVVVIEIVG